MTTDKTILCYGDSNTYGRPPMGHAADRGRFGPRERWPGVLRAELGEDFQVIEEGHSGRTTVHSDPVEGEHKNGLTMLQAILETHMPIHTVILMLGTNDLKARFGVSAFEIALSVERLIHGIATSRTGELAGSPEILLVCPPPILESGFLTEVFRGGAAKSSDLARHYARVAETNGTEFFDAGQVIESDPLDGIHLSRDSHTSLGRAIAQKLKSMGQ